MIRRAVTRTWVAARLVAIAAATAITAIDGHPRTAAVLAVAQATAIVIARLLSSSTRLALAAEVILTSAALALATSPFSPVFAAIPMIALWEVRSRSRRVALVAAGAHLSLMWTAALTIWVRPSFFQLAMLSLGVLVAALTPVSTRRSSDEHDEIYHLVTQVRDLNSIERDPVRVAADLLEGLSRHSGHTPMILESADGERLANIGAQWDGADATRLPLSLDGKVLAILLTTEPLDTNVESDAMITEHLTRLGTALAFAEIRSMASDAERSRLSREMHDGIAQEIASIGYSIDDLLADAPEQLRPQLRDLRGQLTQVVSDLRLSIFELRGRDRGTGVGIALSDLIDRLQPTVPFAISLRLDESHARFARSVEDELLRITQEALTNAKRHSRARHVWVTARLHPPVAELTIEDDGIGLAPGRKDSFGLQVMQERATVINAVLTVRDRHGGGTVVYLLLSPTDLGH